MIERAVVDASPLIYLGRTGYLDLLKRSAGTVCVPEAVLREIHPDESAAAVHACDWLRAVQVEAIPRAVSVWNLGSGESAVLAWAATNPGTVAVLDDLDGRRCAAQLGVRVVGTLGVVLAAKRAGAIPTARTAVEALVESGLYLTEDVIARALALVGE